MTGRRYTDRVAVGMWASGTVVALVIARPRTVTEFVVLLAAAVFASLLWEIIATLVVFVRDHPSARPQFRWTRRGPGE